MGSVIDYIECPNCKHEAMDDYYYKTGEEYINCGNCGYHRSAVIINRDKLLSELTDDDWKITEIKNPYGAFRIKYYESIGYQCGSILNEDNYNELNESVIKNDNVELFSISRLIDGEIVTEVIIDNGPEFDSAGFSKNDR